MALQYVEQLSRHILDLYDTELKCVDLFNSNPDIQIRNGKELKLPKLTVSGYKDHSRTAMGFNAGSYANDYEVKVLDHDRDIEFAIDPLDMDETDLLVSVANIQKRFETTQAVPELDKYTFSKLHAEAVRVGATVGTEALTGSNILAILDAQLEKFEDAGVPLDRLVMYVTPAIKTLFKQAADAHRMQAMGDKKIDRRVYTIDDLQKIVTVPSDRLKTAYDFTNGAVPAVGAKQIDFIIVDPEAQVSRVKYSYINVFEPGSDSRTADKYVYQNRKFNGTFGLDGMLKASCYIHKAV